MYNALTKLLTDTSYAVADSWWPLACGSKVFPILLCAVFALAERKNCAQKRWLSTLPKAKTAFQYSTV
jgi:hypothetical protein